MKVWEFIASFVDEYRLKNGKPKLNEYAIYSYLYDRHIMPYEVADWLVKEVAISKIKYAWQLAKINELAEYAMLQKGNSINNLLSEDIT